MRQKNLIANLVILFASASLYGQRQSTDFAAKEAPSKISSSHAAYYIDSRLLHLDSILSPPPARDSATAMAELTQLVPEKRQQILDRAEEYAHNRLICGVHYASDIEAGRRVAYTIFGSLLASPNFQRDLVPRVKKRAAS